MTKRVHQESQRVKPIGLEGIEKCRQIVKQGFQKINEVMVDSFSAGAIVAVFDALNPANQGKLIAMPVAKVADICFKLINKHNK